MNQLLAFLNSYQHEKKYLYSICSFLRYKSIFRVLWLDWLRPFSANPHPKHFSSAFNFCDHVSTYKKLVYSICSFIPSVPSSDRDYEMKKSVNSICSFLRYNQFKKWGCFIDLFWRNGWFKNPAVWTSESVSTYISETRSFTGFEQEPSK